MEIPLSPPKPLPSPLLLDHALLVAAATAASATVPHLKQVHARLLRSGFDLPPEFLSKLLSVSSSSSPSSLDYALSALLHSSPLPDARLANIALRALAASTSPWRTLVTYGRLRRSGVALDRFSFPSVLRAAARERGGGEAATAATRELHGLAAKTGFVSDPFVQTAVIGAYAALGRTLDARLLFDRMPHRDLVAWGVMIDGYCQIGGYNDALLLFDEMKSSGVTPDKVILATVLSACGRTKNLVSGRALHSYILQSNLSMDAHVQSALINMYASCGLMDIAQKLYDEMLPKNHVASTAMVFGYAKQCKIDVARSIFDQMPNKDIICWSAMISGYAEGNQPKEALKLFNEMQVSGVEPDQITLLSVISACANLGALGQARAIHMFVNKHGFQKILSIRNALIDMYSKCGSLPDAQQIFEATSFRNVITWTSMIIGFAMHGDGHAALGLFDRMKADGVKPNAVTFIGLLYACSHAGLVQEGQRIFKSMVDEHQIEPKHEHYGCMVDLLGRAKLLQEALDLIESMPFRPNVVVWGSLLGACRVHRDVELGEFVAKKLLELDAKHDGAYVLLSNMYAKADRWDDVRKVRGMMESKEVFKEKGYSWAELNGSVHEFMTGDTSHVKSGAIYAKLDELVRVLEAEGYAPDASSFLIDLDEEDKKNLVLLHSEKLALSLGLIESNHSCIRIAKNMRTCEDCHTFMKLVSRVLNKEIILRDRTRFHHFREGICSCGDFW